MGWGNLMEAQTKADAAMELLQEICGYLRDMSERQGGTEHVQFTRRPVVVNLDGTGAGVLALDLRAGTDIHLIGYAGVASAASTGTALVFNDQSMDPTSFVAQIDLGQYFSGSFSEGDRIPENRDLAVQVVGGPPNGWVVLNVSAKVIAYEHPDPNY